MLKIFLLLSLSATMLFSLACQTASAPGNSANTAANAPANLVNSNQPIPPEFSSKPTNIDPANLPPGITDQKASNVNVPANGQIAPGINPKAALKPNASGTPKIPGIPTEAELKKQMTNTKIDANVVNGKVNPPQPSNVQGNTSVKMMQTGKPKSIQ